ncbi:MAG: pseudouridine synthase [Candidatus Aminicenantes bacterium 4484_214]|nr:MAG: pseudouridine synthase [Candidatus Aminicenantes bacterium 4484_214]
MGQLIRLNKFLSQAGIASRRQADELIQQGRVFLNGEAVTSLGVKIDPAVDRVEVDGRPVKPVQKFVYIMLYKPPGYLVTLRDPFGRQTVLELLPSISARVFPVGRLDAASEGLLLLTNDGELAFRLTHPRYGIRKTYMVKVKGQLESWEVKRIKKGIFLNGQRVKPDKFISLVETKRSSRYLVVIHEGRKREIRRIFQAVGAEVVELKRIKFGPLSLGKLKKGAWRYLRREEINSLKKAVGLEADPAPKTSHKEAR